jgi:hypothetical protein
MKGNAMFDCVNCVFVIFLLTQDEIVAFFFFFIYRVTSSFMEYLGNQDRAAKCMDKYPEDVTPADCEAVRGERSYSLYGGARSFSATNTGSWSENGYPRGCTRNNQGSYISFNRRSSVTTEKSTYEGVICKKFVRELLPKTYRPWSSSSTTKRWQILKNFQDGSPSVVTGSPQDLSQKDKAYSSVDLSITPSNTSTTSQAIILAQMGYGTIDISYTLERVRHCEMNYNRPLYPLNKGKAEVEEEVLLFMVLFANISLLLSKIF